MSLCAIGDSSNWATPPCSVKPWFHWLWEAHSRTLPWPQRRRIDGEPKTEGKVESGAAHWSGHLIRYILSKVSVLALFLSVSVLSICLAPCYKQQRRVGEGSMKWVSSIMTQCLNPARNTAVGKRGKKTKQELDVVSFCWKAALCVAVLASPGPHLHKSPYMLSVCVHGSQLCWPKAQVYETVSSHSDLQMLHSHNIALCQWEYIDLDCLLYVTISILLYPLIMDSLQWFIYFRSFPIPAQMDKFLTFRTDLADFLHIVLGAIVDGMRDSALADSLVLAGRCRAEHGHVLHRLAQLSGGNAHATCRKLINSYDFMKKNNLWFMVDSAAKTADMDSSASGCSRRHRAEQSRRWRHSRIPISQAFSIAGKCDFHHLLSKSITLWMCFAQGYVKSALNTIALLRLAWGE